MLTQLTELEGLKVYSDKGMLVGQVDDIVIDLDGNKIYGLYIENTNSDLVEGGTAISIPYRLVKTIGDIIILKGFPKFVRIK